MLLFILLFVVSLLFSLYRKLLLAAGWKWPPCNRMQSDRVVTNWMAPKVAWCIGGAEAPVRGSGSEALVPRLQRDKVGIRQLPPECIVPCVLDSGRRAGNEFLFHDLLLLGGFALATYSSFPSNQFRVDGWCVRESFISNSVRVSQTIWINLTLIHQTFRLDILIELMSRNERDKSQHSPSISMGNSLDSGKPPRPKCWHSIASNVAFSSLFQKQS